jgi:hypothetical protein
VDFGAGGRFQIRTVPSAPAEASQPPSAADARTGQVWPVRAWFRCRRPVPDPHRGVPAGGGKPAAVRGDGKHPDGVGVARQNVVRGAGGRVRDRTVLSTPAEANQLPSGATASARTALRRPVTVWVSVPVPGFQIRTVSSAPAEASQPPSDATINASTGMAGEGVRFGTCADPYCLSRPAEASQLTSRSMGINELRCS